MARSGTLGARTGELPDATGAGMTRRELLELVVGQARSQGFALKRWYTARLSKPWVNARVAVDELSEERRYYALLFSHEFAQSFWKAGSDMTVQMEATTYPRMRADGTIAEVKRRGYLRRRVREDAWRFHLREMSQADEPLRYVRRFLRVEEDLEEEPQAERPVVIVDEEDLLPEDED